MSTTLVARPATPPRVVLMLPRELWRSLSTGLKRELVAPAGQHLLWYAQSNRVESAPVTTGSPAHVAVLALRERIGMTPLQIPEGARRCKICGCCDQLACEGGCGWAKPVRCTSCTTRKRPLPRTPVLVPERIFHG